MCVNFRLLYRKRGFIEGRWEKRIHPTMGGSYILEGAGSSLLPEEVSRRPLTIRKNKDQRVTSISIRVFSGK